MLALFGLWCIPARTQHATDVLVSKRIGVEPEACVGFEDAVLGMEAIRAAGFLHAIDVTALPDYPVIED